MQMVIGKSVTFVERKIWRYQRGNQKLKSKRNRRDNDRKTEHA